MIEITKLLNDLFDLGYRGGKKFVAYLISEGKNYDEIIDCLVFEKVKKQ